MNVLIVEDDPMVGRLNASYLSQINDARLVARCGDVVSALAVLERETVDLVLLDVYLGRRNGLEIAEWIAEHRPTMDVILITAASEIETVREAHRLHVSDYLVKPFTIERFIDAVDACRRRRQTLSGLSGPVEQQVLDTLFRPRARPSVSADNLPKGLTATTLHEVASAVSRLSDGTFSTEDIAERAGVSRVSIRKYLRYLVEQEILSEEFTYGAIGRPAFAYRCIAPDALAAMLAERPR